MYTLYLTKFDGEVEERGTYNDKLVARQVGKKLKETNMAKKYRVKKCPSPKALRNR